MTLECELKFLDVDLEALSRRLADVGAVRAGRYLETNLVFDYPDRSLRAAGILLRLRDKQGRAVLTVKRPPEQEGPSALKVFEEIESEVEEFETVQRALEIVGFRVAFTYEKVREKWSFGGCAVCLDRLPFGDYVEIEGEEPDVVRCVEDLGLGGKPTSKDTYHAINIEYRRGSGLEPDENFVFSPEQRAAIVAEIGKE